MSLIVLEKATLFFGAQPILSQVNLGINEGDRIGLVGANGSGKSTLLRVLSELQALDLGRVHRSRGCRVGYLPQDVDEPRAGDVLSSVLAAVPGRTALEQQIEETRQQLEVAAEADLQMQLAQHQAELNDQLEHFDRTYSEHQALRILNGLGFSQADHARPTADLSGGWRMRVALAGLLFQQPDVLFLDEPTNHLDFPSVLWFDQFLREYRHAMVMICHDRQFLNRHVERIISFEPEGLRSYKGNYDDYLAQRAAEQAVLEAQSRNRDKQIKEMERFVERFKAKATKARQAQSRAKQIARLQSEIEQPIQRSRRLKFSFPPLEHSGKDVLSLQRLHKAFGPRVLFSDVTRAIYEGDRLAIIGANGMGKTTLLKLMAGELKPDQGEIRYGSNVKIGYFSQHHTELLDPRRTVLEEVWRLRPEAAESFVRGVCGAFLFSGDAVEKRIDVLSGGERSRVLLARLLVDPGNLLLMDEPTTHLDIAAAEALAQALSGYQGTLIFVSHNTSFVNHLATKIWDIVEGDVVEHPSNLRDYLEHQARLAEQRAAEPAAAFPEGHSAQGETRPSRQTRKRLEAERRNQLNRQTREVRRGIEQLEGRIAALEAEQTELEPKLADPQLCARIEQYRGLIARYGEVRGELGELYAHWEARQLELEQITAEFAASAEETPCADEG